MTAQACTPHPDKGQGGGIRAESSVMGVSAARINRRAGCRGRRVYAAAPGNQSVCWLWALMQLLFHSIQEANGETASNKTVKV